MRLWFSTSSEVPIYRQLVTQITLAILCKELQPGDRLPSTRELARRFALHPNTISAGYKLLERDGWTEYRHGSGVYVREQVDSVSTPQQVLDQHIAGFFRAIRELDLPPAMVRQRVAEWLTAPPPDHFLVIDPDEDLRQILITEINQVNLWKATGIAPDDDGLSTALTGAISLCRPSKAKLVRAALPSGVELITLQIRSAHAWLAPWLPAPSAQLIAVVSHWPEFLDIARTMLVAAGLPLEALIFVNAHKPHWTRGQDQAAAILCDAFTAASPHLPKQPYRIVFPLLADAAADELRRLARN